jgi:hypothetical protein
MEDRDQAKKSNEDEKERKPLDDEGITELPDREDMSLIAVSPEPMIPLD